MNDFQLGRLFRMRRMRHGWRLEDLAQRCGLSIATLARGEHGAFASVTVVRKHAAGLDLRLEWRVVGRGADVARTLDEEHAAIVEVVAAWLGRHGLKVISEASFSIWGERGRLDLLAFDPATRTVYLVEVKTELADLQDTLGVIDVRERLSGQIAAERNWTPAHRVSLLAVADTPHNRQVVRAHQTIFADWTRANFQPSARLATAPRQLLWVPPAAAGRSAWLAGRRRIPPSRK